MPCILGTVRKNKRRLSRPQQLELLPDFHLLFAGAVFKAVDAVLAALILARHRGILVLKLADLAPLLDQCLDALRPVQRDPSVASYNIHGQDISATSCNSS